jgi:hypothetical protein
MAGAIAAIKEKLQRHPELRFEQDTDFIKILPRDSQGFAVGLRELGGTITVYFEGWHEDFETVEEALDCFTMGLSDCARLRVLSRGGVDYNWRLEAWEDAAWVPYSTTGLLFFPFWRRKVARHLQNQVIKRCPVQ